MSEERQECPCKRKKCPRHSDCAACRAHHAAHEAAPVACEKEKRKEECARQRAESGRKARLRERNA